MRPFLLAMTVLCTVHLFGCQSGGGSVIGNENGSEPVNEQESWEYQKAVNRCHRTGGTRVVKIKGELRCF